MDDLKPHLIALNNHEKEVKNKQSDSNVKTGKTTKEQQDKITDSWKSSPSLKAQGKKILDEIDLLEDKFDKAYKKGDSDTSIDYRKKINALKDQYQKTTGKEYFRHHELSKTEEHAGAFPVAVFQTLLRNTNSFTQIDIQHLDQYSLDYICTPKKEVELDNEFLNKLFVIKKKADYVSSIRIDPTDRKYHFIFTERSFT